MRHVVVCNETLKFKFPENRPESMRRLPWAVTAVAIFVFLAPNFDFAYALAWHDGQRLAQLGLLVAVLLTLAVPGAAASVTEIWYGLPVAGRAALLAAFTLGLISSLLAASPRWALLEWSLLLLLLVTALVIGGSRRTLGERADALLVLLFFATATAYAVTACSVYGAMLLIGPTYGQGFDIHELYTGFSNVRFFGHVQTMLLPFLLLPAMLWGKTNMKRALFWGVPIIWWMLAVGSGTRGTWVALLAGVIGAMLLGGDSGRRWAKWQSFGLLCGLLSYGIFIFGIPKLINLPASFLHRTEDIVSLSGRGELWFTSLSFSAQHPLFGVGPMHYAYWATKIGAHPHNAVLQWLVEWGVPACLLLTGVWVVGGIALAAYVRRAAERGTEQARLFRVALLAALTGASAQAMVDGVLVMPVSQILLVLLTGWAIGMLSSPERVSIATRRDSMLLALVVVFSAAAVIYGVMPEIGHLAERQQAYLEARGPNTALLPRFWALGWINQ